MLAGMHLFLNTGSHAFGYCRVHCSITMATRSVLSNVGPTISYPNAKALTTRHGQIFFCLRTARAGPA